MPAVSEAQKHLMEAAAHTVGGYGGVPQAVGKEFVGDADPIAPQAGPKGRAAGIMFLTPEGETLLLRRGNGGDFPRTYGLPSGHVEEGETLEQAARREAEEESGLAYDGPLELLRDDGHFATFIARGVEKFEVKLCDESSGSEWCLPSEAPQPLHPGLSECFRIAAASTELDICELMRDGLLPSPQQLGNSWYFALRITGSGMSYRSKLDEHVFRDPAIFANDRFAQRCNGLFVVWQHPEKNILDSDSFGSSNVGSIVLPWVDYAAGETWGIARIMDSTAAEQMRSVQLSTSPGVAHTDASEGATVTLDGTDLLIEGNPVLLDHLAVCELGVWDKGGPPVGVKIDQLEEEEMLITTAKADNTTATPVAAPAAPDQSALLGAISGLISAAIAPLAAKVDSMEKNLPAPPLKTATDSAEEIEKKAKADAEAAEKAKADAEEEKEKEEAKAKADAEEKAKMDSIHKDEDEGMFADSQAKCDSVAQLYNQQAPRQMVGETRLAYRTRLVKPFQQHSKQWKDVPLVGLNDAAFAIAEAAIYADAAATASSVPGAGGTLREIRRRGPHGREIIEFAGPVGEWSAPFKSGSRSLIRINKEAA